MVTKTYMSTGGFRGPPDQNPGSASDVFQLLTPICRPNCFGLCQTCPNWLQEHLVSSCCCGFVWLDIFASNSNGCGVSIVDTTHKKRRKEARRCRQGCITEPNVKNKEEIKLLFSGKGSAIVFQKKKKKKKMTSSLMHKTLFCNSY